VAPIARVTRSVTLDLMSGEFIEAARGPRRAFITCCAGTLPMSGGAVVEASLRRGVRRLLGAVLSFLALVCSRRCRLGLMISNGRAFVDTAPWISLAPASR